MYFAARSLRKLDFRARSDAGAINTGTETLVQQHLAVDADINTIVRRFGLTREMPAGIAGGVFGDFSGIHDYEDALAAVERAERGFMSLPADVRERFGNDPAQLIQLAHDLPQELFEARFRSPDPEAVIATAPEGGA